MGGRTGSKYKPYSGVRTAALPPPPPAPSNERKVIYTGANEDPRGRLGGPGLPPPPPPPQEGRTRGAAAAAPAGAEATGEGARCGW